MTEDQNSELHKGTLNDIVTFHVTLVKIMQSLKERLKRAYQEDKQRARVLSVISNHGPSQEGTQGDNDDKRDSTTAPSKHCQHSSSTAETHFFLREVISSYETNSSISGADPPARGSCASRAV
jgi:hypothetical protein